MKILVVGGSGTIGRAVCRSLVAHHEVAVLDPRDPLVEGVEWIRGDGRRPPDCRRAITGRDWVFIKTGLMGGMSSFEAPLDHHDINVGIALNVLAVASDLGVRSVAFDSSETVFGPDDPSPHRENRLPHPRSVYGCTKLLVECYLRTFARTRGLRWVALRYPRVVSPESDNLLTRVAATIRRGESCEISRSNRSVIDLVHIDDVVEVHHRLLAHDPGNEVLHVGPGRGEPVRRILEWCVEDLGGHGLREVAESPSGGVTERDLYHRRMVLDCKLLQESLGWRPRPVEAVVHDTCAVLKDRGTRN